MNHIVFMSDGTKKLMDDEALLELGKQSEAAVADGGDALYTAARNADLPRHMSSGELDENYVAKITVVDTHDQTVHAINPATGQPWVSKEEADAYAAQLNTEHPTIIEMMSQGGS